jgi:TRAP transporter 4TM/12TM fusion protein
MDRTSQASGQAPKLDALDSEEQALGARFDVLPRVLANTARVLALALVAFHVVTSWTGVLPNFIHRSIHVAAALTLVYLLFGARRDGRPAWHDYLSIAVVFAISINVIVGYDRIVNAGVIFGPLVSDLILGGLFIIIALETGRRTVGPMLPLIAIAFLIYAYFGPYFPGLLAHRGFGIETILEISYVTTRGLWGLVTAVIATEIAMFIIFGATIAGSGAGQTLRDISLWVGGRMTGGAAVVAIIASSLFGTISGSTVANVVATGTFTIPMMKSLGYKRTFAGAVEAVASTGGQLMPPVMGAAAFIMAEYLNVPYRDIMLPALLPALLYYGGAFFAVRFYAKKHNLPPVPADQIGKLQDVFRPMRLVNLVLPIGVLVWFLLSGLDTSQAVVYAFAAAVATHLFFAPLSGLRQRIAVFKTAMEGAAIAVAVITPLALCAQIVVMVVALTGVGIGLSEALVGIGEGNLPLALGLSAVVAIVLGMGLPTPAAYVVAAAVLAPTLIGMGLSPISAHLFMFYFAVMSSITPPVCAAVYVAANLANAPWLGVAKYAMAIALPGLIVPFLFVASPEFLLDGTPLSILQAAVTGTFGVAALAAATMGFLLRPTAAWERITLGGAALLLLKVGWITDIMGLGLGAIVLVVHLRRNRADRAADQRLPVHP